MVSQTDADILDWITDGLNRSHKFKLFNDVGQIYEAELARLEFLPFKNDLDSFTQRAAYFEEIDGKKTNHYYISQIKGKGQIGHTNQYSVHWFYPYKGKYHGQMIKSLINSMGATNNDLILDPFVGSGTTLVECAMLGIPSFGIDINPACCIISQIKIDCLELEISELEKIIEEYGEKRIFEYFDNKVLIAQRPLAEGDLDTSPNTLLNQILDENLGTVSMNIEGKIRNFFFMCYIHALSDFTYLQKTNKARSHFEFFKRDLKEYLDTIAGTNRVRNQLGLHWGGVTVQLGDALHIPLDNNSVAGIVTSPPYSIAINYIKNDIHLLDYLGIDPSGLRNKMFGLRGQGRTKVDLYAEDIKKSLIEMYRVLRPQAFAAIVLGDVVVGGIRTEFYKLIQQWALEEHFSRTYLLRRPILGGYARLRYEYIVILQK